MFPETSVTNYQSTLRNISEERWYHLLYYCFFVIFPTQDIFLLLTQFVNLPITLLNYFIMHITLLEYVCGLTS
jgi:hypothetical protein